MECPKCNWKYIWLKLLVCNKCWHYIDTIDHEMWYIKKGKRTPYWKYNNNQLVDATEN